MAPPTSKHDGHRESVDSRFASLTTDPRYRPPSRKHTHVKIDKRFAHMLRDDDFSSKASVDRYGRRVPKGSGRKKLERMYRVDDSDEEQNTQVDDDDDVKKELARVDRLYDPAREGGFSESSSSESDDEDSSSSSDDDDSDEGDVEGDAAVDAGLEQKGTEDIPMGEISSRLAAVNLDWDNIRAVDIMAVAHSFCPADGRIVNVSIYPSEFGKERMEREELEGPPKELFISKKPGANKASNAVVTSPDSSSPDEDDASSAASEDDDDQIQKSLLAHAAAPEPELDSRALRTYQLSRLRYYYAVIHCSSDEAAHALYTAMDGREYLSTANFFDLRFVPDDVQFDDKPKDVCERLPEGYRPQEFVTEALTHSKVRLTWDEEDQERKDAQKRAFGVGGKGKSKGRAAELDENDLKAYVGSDSDSSEAEADAGAQTINGVAVDGVHTAPSESKLSKSEQARRKMREALGLSVDDVSTENKSKTKGSSTKAGAAPAGNMQITFSAGLTSGPTTKSSTTTSSVFQNKPSDAHEETTRERYIRKEKERKARRKAKARATGPDENGDGDAVAAEAKGETENCDAEDPFNDPFFEDPATANATARKAAKRAKREEAAAEAAAAEAKRNRERAELELLMDDDDGKRGGLAGAGFDMAAIRKAEKEAARKGRKGKGKGRKAEKETGGVGGAADDFEMDVQDPRFKGVFENHEFAIDPSSSRFSGTKGMKRLLEEGRKKRGALADDEVLDDRSGSGLGSKGKIKGAGQTTPLGGGELDELVRKIKRRKAG